VLLRVPWVNKAHEAALVLWARRRMGARERWRQQQLADAGSSVRTTAAAAALRVATKQVCVVYCGDIYTHTHTHTKARSALARQG